MESQRRKTYLDSTDESALLLSSESYEMDYRHPKKRNEEANGPQTPRDQTIECDIQPTDTLSNLALKYNIPLAELKRVNNILKDSEFYALKRIKIPVRPASFLRELIPGVHSDENKKENGWYVESKDNVTSSNLSSVMSSGYSSPCSELESVSKNASSSQESRDTKKVKKMFKEMDRDLERIKSDSRNQILQTPS
uniref:LysM and putative peptidoglycan-binding domain-containing protein 3 n=1 Tax=Acartia pacifica TaxID=335913 RepID=A0A0U2T484_ACAPC|nr:lysM and putative peptidoglycan-binding domain-containing protein 3 [Acartia pacifica]